MADILLNVIIEGVSKKVISLIGEEIGLVWGFKKELDRLSESLTMIRAVLHDAETRQVQEEAVKLWMERLKGVADDADTVLDEFGYEILRRKVEIKNQMTRKVLSFFSSSNPIAFRHKMAHKIKNVNTSLEKINKEAIDFGLQRGGVDAIPILVSLNRESDSFLDNLGVVGRENEASKIVKMLIDSDNQEVLSIIPIVGIGGLGKTTLAKLIYNDEQIIKRFDVRIWICVSDKFDTKNLLIVILESLKGTKCEVQSKNTTLLDLEKELGKKKYLLILDDVWNEDIVEWEDFKSCLLGVNTTKGNSIIVTTRKRGVGSIVGTCEPHDLEGLSEDDCWSIIKQKAFAVGGAPETLELEAIGLKITKKCQGVPLVAKVIGGTMFSKKERNEWLEVQDSVISDSGVGQKGVLDILKLSFDHLPSPAFKKCFAYCSIFPKDCNIKKKKLIQLWMAVGFLQPGEGSTKKMEDVGNEFFNALLWNSLFQDVKVDKYDYVVGCKMHDLVHDLGRSISKHESFSSEDSNLHDIPRARHLALYSGDIMLSNENAKYLHTLFSRGGLHKNTLFDFKCLRVLNFTRALINKLPSSISKLIHLRYLDLSHSKIRVLPKSVGKLYNLQTLRLNCCWNLLKLPNEVCNLISLRHIHYKEHYQMPQRMGWLTSLQTLPIFKVSRCTGCRIEELGNLKQLRGKVEIHNLEEVTCREEAQKADLLTKKDLCKLKLVWIDHKNGNMNDEEVLEGLQPHPNLKSLTIIKYMGDNFPSWMMNIDNLVEISLIDCKKCKEIPMLGQLPHLRDLALTGMDELKSIDASFYGDPSEPVVSFPFLVCLKLFALPNLEEWKETKEVMCPHLENLTIKYCPKLTAVPSHFPSLKLLIISHLNSNSLLTKICANKSLTTLAVLHITQVLELTTLPDSLFQINNYLTELSIKDCPILTHVVPNNSLRSLEIYRCPKLTYLPQGLSSLRDLKIEDCEGLAFLPSGTLNSFTSLEHLTIKNCCNLVSLPELQQLHSSLSFLEVIRCNKLNSLPEDLGYLTRLNTLRIGPFSKELNSFLSLDGIQNLRSSLVRVELFGHPHWESLPGALQHVTALTRIQLHDFGVEALPEWFGNFLFLKQLIIVGCKKLKHLPNMERLGKLEMLQICECPLLKETQGEWSKTVPYQTNIDIDFYRVKRP